MDCRAEVIKAEREKALVRVARMNCAECGGCGMLSRNHDDTMEFTVPDRVGAREGDEVILHLPSRRLFLSYLLAFGLPVLAIPAAYLAGMALSALAWGAGVQVAAILAAIISGLLAFWGGVKLADRIGLSPFIKEVVNTGAGHIDSPEGDGDACGQ